MLRPRTFLAQQRPLFSAMDNLIDDWDLSDSSCSGWRNRIDTCI
jgi:hypothetical protein